MRGRVGARQTMPQAMAKPALRHGFGLRRVTSRLRYARTSMERQPTSNCCRSPPTGAVSGRTNRRRFTESCHQNLQPSRVKTNTALRGQSGRWIRRQITRGVMGAAFDPLPHAGGI